MEIRNGSCEDCNRDFGVAEAAIKEATTPLLNLLQIENRYNGVPNAQTAGQHFTPVVLADEMTLIGHVLSPATKFEDPTVLHEQWSSVLSEFCAQKGVVVTPITGS